MANNKNHNSTMSLRSVLEKDKLTGTNFFDWFQNLRIVLKQERKLYVLDEPLPEEQLIMFLELKIMLMRSIIMTLLMLHA